MTEEKIIKTKVSWEWYFACWYFQSFAQTIKGEVFGDEYFQKMYNEMTEYINDKMEPSTRQEILDVYVVIEQKNEE